ncbi:GTP-binding protein HflX [Peptoniphilus koenoeneniae]|uniref:GTPase HflX n=1 Tax=Peptoniphilus koenoeneniae TaxID=507751 RepID=A0ABU0AUK3_9FIRM|nr:MULTISPECIES: GTPase HflX [Peptoniphilus]ERT59009.1 GTP-binding protein HflX [Peptoniphilus sp. BV3C26]MDQ0274476.1 GTP-binding protein HflX [Peptoniphilus koenoeneniae]
METTKKIEKVIIVATDLGSFPNTLSSSLEELRELVKADEGQVVGVVTQNIEKFNPKYLIGTGKVKEIKEIAKNMEVETVIFNDELSGIQVRNLEEELKLKVVDRTNLILDIFAMRANTYEAKLQVQLAQREYQLPRLLGIKGWSRTGGGIGTRGPGEQIIETDRRRLLREINSIKKKLKKAELNRENAAKKRRESPLPNVALVGYTNAGKSTILNRIKENTGRDVFVKNMLFATLDPGIRQAKLLNGRDFIISDTVGFVSKLPTKLVEAFKSTLEEVKNADLIVHVIDSSNSDLEIQYKTTMDILKELEVLDRPILTVFNKMDRAEFEEMIVPQVPGDKIFISAKKDENMEVLLKAIEKNLGLSYTEEKLLFPFSQAGKLNEFLNNFKGEILEYNEEGTLVKATLSEIEKKEFGDFIV